MTLPRPALGSAARHRVFCENSAANFLRKFRDFTETTPLNFRRKFACLALALALATPALADPPLPPPDPSLGPPLSASAFEALVTGQTLTYQADGVVWGTEQYLPGRRVIWAFTGQDCEEGRWHAEGPAICFLYEATEGPNCWLFYQGASGLVARALGSGNRLSEVARSPEPLQCGPRVGV